MKTIIAFGFASVSMFVASAEGLAFTPSETNKVARRLIIRAKNLRDCHDIPDEGELYKPEEDPGTWYGFLGLDETNGWTVAAKKAAFDWYLSTLATNDCETLDESDELYARVAVGKCKWLNYTNSVNAMKTLALNPKGICRDSAIELAIKFSPVDDLVTTFVETIMTNSAGYSLMERGTASCQYADKLLSFNATNENQRTVVANAIGMFYKNRMLAPNAFSVVDHLFVRYIDNYTMSSNRLEHALHVLSLPDCGPVAKRNFTSVTNQLLSSGQPLPWINVGWGGN